MRPLVKVVLNLSPWLLRGIIDARSKPISFDGRGNRGPLLLPCLDAFLQEVQFSAQYGIVRVSRDFAFGGHEGVIAPVFTQRTPRDQEVACPIVGGLGPDIQNLLEPLLRGESGGLDDFVASRSLLQSCSRIVDRPDSLCERCWSVQSCTARRFPGGNRSRRSAARFRRGIGTVGPPDFRWDRRPGRQCFCP